MNSIKIVSMGDTFSGGGIVLNEIKSNLKRNTKVQVFSPDISFKLPVINRLFQIIWLLFWPIKMLFVGNGLLLLAHSFFLLTPFLFLIKKERFVFLFQGEEYFALRGKKSLLIQFLVEKRMRSINTISTNEYLSNIAKKNKSNIIETECFLGAKRFFFREPSCFISEPKKIVFFARSGFNKGLVESFYLAEKLPNDFISIFITPNKENVEAIKKINNSKVVITTDPDVIADILDGALVLFLPSYYEGLSLPMLESLNMKVPVITFSNGFPKFLSEKTRYVTYIENRDIYLALNHIINKSEILKKDLLLDDISFLKDYSFEKYCNLVSDLCLNLSKSIK